MLCLASIISFLSALTSILPTVSSLASVVADGNKIAIQRMPLRQRQQQPPQEASPFCYVVSNPNELVAGKHNFLATQIWPSARIAAQALVNHMDPQWKVCELGCGPALPALTAASLGSPRVYATDLDPLALQMVKRAAYDQGWSERVQTSLFDLTCNPNATKNLPKVDLYLLSDVFESSHVAKGAARVVSQILDRDGDDGGESKRVWVFAQSDRSQRDDFLTELRELRGGDLSLSWAPYQHDKEPKAASPLCPFLWLCTMEETEVFSSLTQ